MLSLHLGHGTRPDSQAGLVRRRVSPIQPAVPAVFAADDPPSNLPCLPCLLQDIPDPTCRACPACCRRSPSSLSGCARRANRLWRSSRQRWRRSRARQRWARGACPSGTPFYPEMKAPQPSRPSAALLLPRCFAPAAACRAGPPHTPPCTPPWLPAGRRRPGCRPGRVGPGQAGGPQRRAPAAAGAGEDPPCGSHAKAPFSLSCFLMTLLDLAAWRHGGVPHLQGPLPASSAACPLVPRSACRGGHPPSTLLAPLCTPRCAAGERAWRCRAARARPCRGTGRDCAAAPSAAGKQRSLAYALRRRLSLN